MDACTEAESGSVPLPVRLRRASRLSPRVSWAESRYRATESRRASPSSVRRPPETPRRPSALAMPLRSRTRTDPESSRPSPPATRSDARGEHGVCPPWTHTPAVGLDDGRRPGAKEPARPARGRRSWTYPSREPVGRQTVEWADVSGDRELHSLGSAAQLDPGLARGECPSCLRPGHGDGPEARIGEGDAGLTVELIEPGAVKVERGVAGDPVTASRREPEKSGINGLDGRPPAVEQRLLSE